MLVHAPAVRRPRTASGGRTGPRPSARAAGRPGHRPMPRWGARRGPWSGPASRREQQHRDRAGRTTRVRTVAVTRPPMTTTARGFCTSAPVAVGERHAARSPGPGPGRSSAPAAPVPSCRRGWRGAREAAPPAAGGWRSSPPGRSAPPRRDRQMKPTAAEMEKARPRPRGRTTPPGEGQRDGGKHGQGWSDPAEREVEQGED